MRALLFLILGATSVLAQADGREVFLRLLTISPGSLPAESFLVDPSGGEAGKAAVIKSYLNHEGLTVKLAGNEVLFSKSAKKEDAADAANEIAKATLPKEGGRFIILFVPAENEKFSAVVVPDSLKDFPPGAFHVANTSKFPLKLTLEDKAYPFEPGEQKVIADPPMQDNQHCAMRAYTIDKGKENQIGSGLLPHPGTKRSIQVVFDNPATKKTELKGFKDISPPSAEGAPK